MFGLLGECEVSHGFLTIRYGGEGTPNTTGAGLWLTVEKAQQIAEEAAQGLLRCSRDCSFSLRSRPPISPLIRPHGGYLQLMPLMAEIEKCHGFMLQD
jgi:hypothetical protein